MDPEESNDCALIKKGCARTTPTKNLCLENLTIEKKAAFFL